MKCKCGISLCHINSRGIGEICDMSDLDKLKAVLDEIGVEYEEKHLDDRIIVFIKTMRMGRGEFWFDKEGKLVK